MMQAKVAVFPQYFTTVHYAAATEIFDAENGY